MEIDPEESADFASPSAKRQKLDPSASRSPGVIAAATALFTRTELVFSHHESQSKTSGSHLFTPFRTIGLVTPTNVGFTSQPLGKTTFQITTSVGRRIQTYDLSRGLGLVFLSSLCPGQITATRAWRDRVFVAWRRDRRMSGRVRLNRAEPQDENENVVEDGNGYDARTGIWVFKRGKKIGELEHAASYTGAVNQIIVFGKWIVGVTQQAVEVWKNEAAEIFEHYTSIHATSSVGADISQQGQNRTEDIFTCAATLPTFLNKIFVGRRDGKVDVLNVSTGKLVHTIEPESQNTGPITALAKAQAVSLLAVAYRNGTVNIIDVETEEVVVNLRHAKHDYFITSMSFRSDGQGAGDDGRSAGVLATASTESGDITIWDLNKGGRVAGVLRGAHGVTSKSSSGISGIEFLSGQAVMVSSGMDNALRTWVFDQVPFSPIPRILHERSGQAAPASTLRFLPAASDGNDAAGKWLLAGSNDRSLWGFSLRKDGQSTELSQGAIKHKAKKLGKFNGKDDTNAEDFKCPPITSLACSLNRDGGIGALPGNMPVWTNPDSSKDAEDAAQTGWESIVTAHEDDKYARTWFWGRKKAGRWAFETSDHKPVTTVAITACGTFALVGSAGGVIDMHNLQSGQYRQRFPAKLKVSQARQLKAGEINAEQVSAVYKGHTSSITGIVVDNTNEIVVSSGLDGKIIFWDFLSGQARTRMTLPGGAAAVKVQYNSVSSLLALSCDDLAIRVIDVETQRVVRELWGCVGQIYDHCFSHDGRWVLAASQDSVVRVFDLATGHLIDAFRLTTCTSMAFSSTGEFLATAHAGEIGVKLWNNSTLYALTSTRQIDEEKDIIDLTDNSDESAGIQLAKSDNDIDQIDSQERSNHSDHSRTNGQSVPTQLDASLLTLSLQPKSQWQTLLNLDSIRARNKPIQPPEKPKAAPFFLGSTLANGINGTKPPLPVDGVDLPDRSLVTINNEDQRSRITKLSTLQPVKSVLTTYLERLTTSPNPDTTEFILHMKSLTPSVADLEIRSLSLDECTAFARSLTAHLSTRQDFELLNTWMSVFLKHHGEFVSEVEEVRQAITQFQAVMVREEERLSRNVGWTRGVVEFLRSAR